MGRIVVAGMGTLFFAIGIGLGWFQGKPTLEGALASESWPTVEGVVLESKLETKQASGRDGGPSYKAVVVYEYEVAAERHSSDRIWFGSEVSTSNRKQMSDIVKQYPERSTVSVHYDPKQHSEAVLQPGVFLTSAFMLIFGAVFAVVGGILLGVAGFAMKPRPASYSDDPFGATQLSNRDQLKPEAGDDFSREDRDDWDED